MLEVSADAFGSFHSFRTHLPAANLEARGGIEPPIKVLQTFALPLGDRASGVPAFYQNIACIVFFAKGTQPKKGSRGAMFRPPRSCQADFA